MLDEYGIEKVVDYPFKQLYKKFFTPKMIPAGRE